VQVADARRKGSRGVPSFAVVRRSPVARGATAHDLMRETAGQGTGSAVCQTLPAEGQFLNGPPVVACVRSLVKDEDHEQDVGVEHDLAVAGEHPAAGQCLHLLGELVVGHLVELEP
jgi:hypothetical protein